MRTASPSVHRLFHIYELECALWVAGYYQSRHIIFYQALFTSSVHVATMTLLPYMFSPPLVDAICGVILMEVPYEVSGSNALMF